MLKRNNNTEIFVLSVLSSSEPMQRAPWSVTSKGDDDKGNYQWFCLTVGYNVISNEAEHQKGFRSVKRSVLKGPPNLIDAVLGGRQVLWRTKPHSRKHRVETCCCWGRAWAPLADISKRKGAELAEGQCIVWLRQCHWSNFPEIQKWSVTPLA